MTDYHFVAKFYGNDETGYVVVFPDLPNCLAEGDVLQNVFENAHKSLKSYLSSMTRRGEKIPLPGLLNSALKT